MDNAQEIFDGLSAPFPADSIDWRVGSTNQDKTKGMALAYLDARAVMDRLDAVCGPGNWQAKYPHANGKTVCEIGIRIERDGAAEWVWKSDGAGDTDFEAEKGALSDAFKRAAVRWGVGRYLYDMKAPWIAIEAAGRSFKIPDAERKKLDTMHEDFAHKAGWGLRAGVQAYKVLIRVIDEYVTDQAAKIDFLEKNEGMIAQLPVAMRRHLMEKLDRIGAPQQEAAE